VGFKEWIAYSDEFKLMSKSLLQIELQSDGQPASGQEQRIGSYDHTLEFVGTRDKVDKTIASGHDFRHVTLSYHLRYFCCQDAVLVVERSVIPGEPSVFLINLPRSNLAFLLHFTR